MPVIYLRKECLKHIKEYITFYPGKFSNENYAIGIGINNKIIYEFPNPTIINNFQVSYWLWLVDDHYNGLQSIIELRNENFNIVYYIQYHPWWSSFIVNGDLCSRFQNLYGSPGYWIYTTNYYDGTQCINYFNNAGSNSSRATFSDPIKYITIGECNSWSSPYGSGASVLTLGRTDDIIFYYNQESYSPTNVPLKYHDENYLSYSLYGNNKELYGM